MLNYFIIFIIFACFLLILNCINYQSIQFAQNGYGTDTKGNIQYLGCYNQSGDKFEGKLYKLVDNSINNCSNYCKTGNYKYFTINNDLCHCFCNEPKKNKIKQTESNLCEYSNLYQISDSNGSSDINIRKDVAKVVTDVNFGDYYSYSLPIGTESCNCIKRK